MHAKIIKIGTSKGIRIPKYLIEKYEFLGEWGVAAERIANTAQETTIQMPVSDWDKDEWEW